MFGSPNYDTYFTSVSRLFGSTAATLFLLSVPLQSYYVELSFRNTVIEGFFFVVVVVTISFKSASWNCEKNLNHRRFYKLTDSVHSK